MAALTLAASIASPALAADGDLDPTFGGTGVVITDSGGNSESAAAVAVQTDAKIVVAGRLTAGAKTDFALFRYDNAGSPDVGFGSGGLVTTTIGAGNDTIAAMALQPADGHIVVAGSSGNAVALARYLSDTGALDPSFGAGGVVTTAIGASAAGRALAIDTDGRIIVAGTANSHFFVARYTVSGTLDTSFNTTGIATASIGVNDWGEGVVVQPDHKIVVAGYSDMGPSENFALLRYTISGTLDFTFNTTGKVNTDIAGNSNDQAHAIALQSDNKLVVSGFTNAGGQKFATARYNANGSLDSTFGASGKVTTTVGTTNEARAVVIQPTGRIVVAGYSGGGGNANFALVRYTISGTLDTSFNSAGATPGIVLTDLAGSSDDLAYAAAVQPDNRIVVAGSSDQGTFTAQDFAVARYESPVSAPTLTSFGKTMLEDGLLGFTAADFSSNYSDPGGNAMRAVKITTLPANGTLRLAGSAVAANQVITASNLVSLTFTPDPTWYGNTGFGWNATNGLLYAAVDASADITVSLVNHAPSFTKGADQTAVIGAGPQFVAGWASAITAGPPNEAGQALTFTLTTSKDALFTGLPGVDSATGDLTYQPSAHVFGTAVVTVTLKDDGGTANGGADTSAPQTFHIDIQPRRIFLPHARRAAASVW